MTDYNGEQNNVFGEVQPMAVTPEEELPVEATAVESASVAEPQPVAEPVMDVSSPDCGIGEVSQPQAVEPVAPTYQEPIQPQTAPPVVPVYQAPVYQATVPPAQIPASPVYQAPAEPQPPKKSKSPIIIGILAVLLVIAVAVILVLALGDKDDSDDKNDKGNKKETEQVDDTDSSEDEDDNTNADDNVPVRKGYTEYLDSMGDLFCGDLNSVKSLLPEAVWECMRIYYKEELGYLPSVDEVIGYMFGEIDDDMEWGAEYATYEIVEEIEADKDTIDLLGTGLRSFFIVDEIEEAYEIYIVWTIGVDGEEYTFEDTAYGVCFGNEWTLMSQNYMLYSMDTDIVQRVFATLGEKSVQEKI